MYYIDIFSYNIIMKDVIIYKSNKNVVYSCKYHVVWCPKYRRKVLIDGIDERLKDILLEIIKETNSEILEIEVMPDHVHLILDVDPQYGVAKVVKHLKGKSSNILRKEFPVLRSKIPTLWTNSYFVSTVGGVTIDIVKKYIENQKGV